MPYTVQDLLVGIGAPVNNPTGGVWAKLSQRDDVIDDGKQWIADAALELSQNYSFQELGRTSPAVVALTPGQYEYDPTTWYQPGDTVSTLVPSFWLFYNYPLNLGYGSTNSGNKLSFKTIDFLEPMFSTPGVPAFWTRYAGKFYVAPVPNGVYYTYLRYQRLHPFSNPVALTDPLYFPMDWREILEYAAALRGAGNLRMTDYQTQYYNILFGDPKKRGDLGILSARVSSMESDIISNQSMRQIRPLMRR